MRFSIDKFIEWFKSLGGIALVDFKWSIYES